MKKSIYKIVTSLRKKGRLMLILFAIIFGFNYLSAQYLFSISYNELSQENIARIKSQATNRSMSATSLTRSIENNYDISLSSVQNTRIIILNEATGNNVVIIPTCEALTQFQLSPFFIEELRLSVLGDADRYLVIEAGTDFSVRNAVSVSRPTENIFIPRYFYGTKENVREALPRDRRIIGIFKMKPRFIPAFPDDPELLRRIAQMEEEMSYYVYMFKLPDGTFVTYDKNFNPCNVSQNTLIGDFLRFDLTGQMNATQRNATEHALRLWDRELFGNIPVDILNNVVPMAYGILGGSFHTQMFLNTQTNTWYPSALWNQIVGFDATNMNDISLQMNSNYSWYYGVSANPPSHLFDYVTVMLHEVCHGLGFAANILQDGRFFFVDQHGDGWTSPWVAPNIFVRQLFRGNVGQNNLPYLTQSQRAVAITSGDLFAGRPGSHLLVANGGNRVRMHAPTRWQDGSSVSHWDWNVNFTTFMRHQISRGVAIHTFDNRDIAMLLDIGWQRPPTISGPSVIPVTSPCQATFTVSVPQGMTISNLHWSHSPGLRLTSSNGTTQATFGRSLNQDDPDFATIYFSFDFNEGRHTIHKTVQARHRPGISVNCRTTNQAVHPHLLRRYCPYYFRALSVPQHTHLHYIWELQRSPDDWDGGFLEEFLGQSTIWQPTNFWQPNAVHHLALRTMDHCNVWTRGSTESLWVQELHACYSFFFTIHPNPADSELIVEFNTEEEFTLQSRSSISQTVNITLFDGRGHAVRQTSWNSNNRISNKVHIDTRDLPESTYYLHIEHNGEIQKHQIIIQRN